jgi:hypothetical protein
MPDAPWFVRAAWERGSASTLCGIRIEQPAGMSHPFTVEAVGDTCVFHIRRGLLVRAIPALTVDDFGTTPSLLRSVPGPAPARVVHRGRLCHGDQLIVATDGLSHFLLDAVRAGHPVWRDLDRASDDELAGLAHVARVAVDDDIALVWIRSGHDDECPPTDERASTTS